MPKMHYPLGWFKKSSAHRVSAHSECYEKQDGAMQCLEYFKRLQLQWPSC